MRGATREQAREQGRNALSERERDREADRFSAGSLTVNESERVNSALSGVSCRAVWEMASSQWDIALQIKP